MAAFQFPAAPFDLQTVENPITGSTYQWRPEFKKWVLTRQAQTQVGDIIWEGDTPPDPIDDYKLWYSTDTLELYFYYCDVNGVCAWVPTSAPITALEELTEFASQAEVDIDQLQYKQQLLQVALDDIYLTQQQQQGTYVSKVGGDEMQGPFKVLSNPDIPSSRDARRIETYGVFSGSDTTALRLGTSRDRIYVGHDDTSFNGLVKIDRIAEKNAGNSVQFENDIKMGINQIKNLAEATDDKDAVNYGQVKEELEELRDKIVGEVSIGTWKFDNVSSGVTPLAGCFITKKDSNPPQLSPNDINVIRISDEDVNGNPGVFDWEIGDLLTFTNVNNTTQSIKFRVNSAPANSGSYWIVSVAHVTSNYDFFQNAEYYLSHINIDVSVDVNALDDTYLRLDCSNDPLETELEIKTPDFGEAALTLNGKRDNTNNATATIAFKSQFDTNENYAGYLTYRTTGQADDGFFRFNRNVEFNSKKLTNVSDLQINSGGTIFTGTHDQIKFRTPTGSSSGSGWVEIQRPTVGDRRGFSIRGKAADNTDTDILWTFTNSTGGDAVNYDGKMTNDTNLVNKKWIDDNKATKSHSHSGYASSSHNHDTDYVKGNYTITKSNGNYYIS